MPKITKLHIELSTFCNAGCADCSRNKYPNQFRKTHLDFWDSMSKIDQSILKNLSVIRLCGTYGDPILHPKFLEIIQWIRTHLPQCHIEISTNGEPRTVEWWEELAKILGKHGVVIFGIDGLEDTHAIYRENTDFNTIIDNAKTFINAGGRAYWQYLIFAHNEKQLVKALKMSKDLGFENFIFKNSRPSVKHPLSKKDVSAKNVLKGCLFTEHNEVYLQADGNFLACCIMGNFNTNPKFTSTTLDETVLDRIEEELKQSWTKPETMDRYCKSCPFIN